MSGEVDNALYMRDTLRDAMILFLRRRLDWVQVKDEKDVALGTLTRSLMEKALSNGMGLETPLTQLIEKYPDPGIKQPTSEKCAEASNKVIAASEEMKTILEMVDRVAPVDCTVLIYGESGTGKEVIATEIHRRSKRNQGPFIKVNCGAIPDTLMESEFFGYEKGAFTGANQRGKPGFFELADTGSIFLDEIDELPLNLQVKLLRVLQDKEVTRLGGTKSRKVDVRIITATKRDFKEMIEKGSFREDLLYRINVVLIKLPPLRARKSDIPPAVEYFLDRFNKEYQSNKKLHPSVIELFMRHDWPGNMRQLEHVIEQLVITVPEQTILPEHLPSYLRALASPHFPSLKEAIESTERELIAQGLKVFGTSRKLARALGVSQPTILRKMKKLGIKS